MVDTVGTSFWLTTWKLKKNSLSYLAIYCRWSELEKPALGFIEKVGQRKKVVTGSR